MADPPAQAALARQSQDTTHNRALIIMEMLNRGENKTFGMVPRQRRREWRNGGRIDQVGGQ